ncbi:MAG TPA: SEC-C domain-containing protein [Candidatus Bathyarchaeia archaeon]|nr:SEC-C domain-containing protein [Candidatus Bathyarchaeia archaeon]
MVNVKYQWNTVQNNTFLIRNYPGLTFVTQDRIEGKLKFSALYDLEKDIILINPTANSGNKYYIEDTYSIRIDLPDNPQYQIPIIYETEGRILAAGRKHGISDLRDLHVYKDSGSVCLCPQPQLIERILTGKSKNLQLLLDELVIPYFYQQSFFERYGHWPIKNYSHDYPAIFEYYFREKNKNGNFNRKLLDSCIISLKSLAKGESYKYLELLTEPTIIIKSTSKCFCGSGRKYKKCHRRKFTKEAKEGFISFMNDLRNK